MKLAFTEEAIADLDHIHQFLFEAEVDNHEEVVNDIVSCAENLRIFPRLGRLVPHLPESSLLRDYYHKNFILRYQIESNDIYILRIWHQRENERNA